MKITREESEEMLEAAKPLIKWMEENAHLMCEAVVSGKTVSLNECVARMMIVPLKVTPTDGPH